MDNKQITKLRSINDFPDLVAYLRDELDWPIEEHDFDDLTFEYSARELGIDELNAAKIIEIKRLRPLDAHQPWGIFFVSLEPKQLPVVALRRLLSKISLKKRASANKADQAVWHHDDILFISNFGEENERQLSFAHFAVNEDKHDLPILKVLGWDNKDTRLHIDAVVEKLKEKLIWPEDVSDTDAWRQKWREAFTLRHKEVVSTSKEMAIRLAELARNIRDSIISVLQLESDNGPLRQIMETFKEALIHDLDEAGFADMYAQTIAYGLLSARIADPHGSNTVEHLGDHMRTNPFLKELMETFLDVGGRKRGKQKGAGLDFDELGVSEVVELLDNANMEAVVRDFGDRNPQEDPVIHFYELFLKEYDARKRVQRGVYYTPQPVVSYIVRSVHELLQTEFGLEDGLADTTTWDQMLKKHPEMKLPPLTDEPGEKRTISRDEPFVQILDPATGTATFLVEVIEVIHQTLLAKWTKQGLSRKKQDEAWNEYVPRHLLPRLHAYELMMAPYAIAHMKVGLKLAETGYSFGTEERVRIYLTNALEPWVKQLPLIGFDALAHEAAAVNEIKRHQRFTVIIGNPPYSKMSGNLGEYAVRLIEQFRYVAGERIIERGALAFELNLQDDYIKFWALLRHVLLTTDIGVGAYITNSRYLASPTLRGMRWNLKSLFDYSQFLDLGGQVSERAAVSGTDENVFDIEQGVAVGIGVRRQHHSDMMLVGYSRYHGSRNEKYAALNGGTAQLRDPNVSLDPPFFRFSRGIDEAELLFSSWHDLADVLPFNSGCIITSRDNLAIDFDRCELLEKVTRFSISPRGDRCIEKEIGYSSKEKWDVEACKTSIRDETNKDNVVRRVLYRPFDTRWIYYSTKLLDTPSKPVCDSVFDHENLVLLTPKVNTSESFNHILVSRVPAEKKSCSHDRATQMFPLYLYDAGFLNAKQWNVGRVFESAMREAVAGAATPEGCFAYIYALLHAPEYRRRFGNALRDSYPRIPIPTQLKLFRALAQLGRELTALHLLESPKLGDRFTHFIGKTQVVSRVGWTADNCGTVWIDGKGTAKAFQAGTSGFAPVPEEVWKFHIGGYQVCEKWLKDRGPKKGQSGRILSSKDIDHYSEIVFALSETIRIMAEIDEVIEAHGGWPGAFVTGDQAAEPAKAANDSYQLVGETLEPDLFDQAAEPDPE